ncbi:MAG: DUF2207 domain-containing protein [Actinomycetia bacterium]|nr:DUF2207 domain-containing protein [Actinomycetes bacterium]
MTELALILGPMVLAGVFAWWDRRRRRDLIWSGITPGERALEADQPIRTFGAAGDDTVVVRFTPPDEMTPGLSGTIIDGSADKRDVAATLIDLAVRDYLLLHAEAQPPKAAGTGARGRKDAVHWRISRTDKAVDAGLESHEVHLLQHIEAMPEQVRVDALPAGIFAQTQDRLRTDAVEHGWFRPPVRPRPRWVAMLFGSGAVAALVATLQSGSSITLALTVGLAASAIGLLLLKVAPASRTAAGTASRAQALGFQRYLATAEARQIRLEEAQDLFSRFLPWAIAFGVADQWSKTFAEAAALGHAAGVDVIFDLHWIHGLDALGHLVTGLDGAEVLSVIDHADPTQIFAGIDALTDNLSEAAGALGDALGGVAESLGDFISDIDFDF